MFLIRYKKVLIELNYLTSIIGCQLLEVNIDQSTNTTWRHKKCFSFKQFIWIKKSSNNRDLTILE